MATFFSRRQVLVQTESQGDLSDMHLETFYPEKITYPAKNGWLLPSSCVVPTTGQEDLVGLYLSPNNQTNASQLSFG